MCGEQESTGYRQDVDKPTYSKNLVGVHLNTMGGMLAKGSGWQPSGLILKPGLATQAYYSRS